MAFHREPENLAQFQELLKNNPLVVVAFFAKWSQPSKMIAPLFFQCAETFSNVTFAKVDVDDASDISIECGIRILPTFICFKDGQKVDDVYGASVPLMRDKIASLAA